MQDIAKDFTGLCQNCFNEPIFIRKRSLCKPCYDRLRRLGEIDTTPSTKLFVISNRNIDPLSINQFPLPPFKESQASRLKRRYGKSILKDLRKLWKNPAYTLERIGQQHGFSREYARQIFKNLYGVPYTDPLKRKMEDYHHEITCVNHPRRKLADYKGYGPLREGIASKVHFLEECEKRGLSVEIPCRSGIDFILQGKKIIVKYSRKPFKAGKRALTLYHYYYAKGKEKADYIACYHGTTGLWFIIPASATESKHFYIACKPSNYRTSKNRFWEFKDAWHLFSMY